MSQFGIEIKKPQSIFMRDVKLNDAQGFFTSLIKVGVYASSGNAIQTEMAGSELIKNVGMETPLGEIGWRLIQQTACNSLREIFTEIPTTNISGASAQLSNTWPKIADQIELCLEQANIIIGFQFFEKVDKSPFISDLGRILAEWLIDINLSAGESQALAERLPDKFARKLHEEYKRNEAVYKKLFDSNFSPVTPLLKLQQGQARYNDYLASLTQEEVFGGGFSIESLYIPLRAYWEDEHQDIKKGIKHIVDAESHLLNWIAKGDKDDAFRVVSGDPGSGKSTLMKTFAKAMSLSSGVATVYIEMQYFSLVGTLESRIIEYLGSSKFSDYEPLMGDRRVVLIFDGLDEFAQLDDDANDKARQILLDFKKLINLANSQKILYQAVVSSRSITVNGVKEVLGNSKQILHLLDYAANSIKHNIHDPDNLLTMDQRSQWWRQYGDLKDQTYTDLPTALNTKALQDVTSQPLFNYLVALSYERGKIDFSQVVSINDIYYDILENVHDRVWARGHNPYVKQLVFSKFVEILEEIGLAAWHSDGRSVKADEVANLCIKCGLSTSLAGFEKSAESGATRLIAGFYFRPDTQRAYEFTHKTFAEYLTARRIFRTVTELSNSHADKEMKLYEWLELAGKSPISNSILTFLANETKKAYMDESDETFGIFESFVELFNFQLSNGFPTDRSKDRPAFKEEVRQSRNAEECLLATLAAFYEIVGSIFHPVWETQTSFGELMSRLQPQRATSENTIGFQSFQFISAEGCILIGRDLSMVKLSGANLTMANLLRANLFKANLCGAQLSGANLSNTNLSGANLTGADLSHANLSGSRMSDATLCNADLSGANLSDADLSSANLSGANLSGATLSTSRLNRADLSWADLSGATLPGAILCGAKLLGAKLPNTYLSGADMSDSHLTGVNLSYADLSGVRLFRANLSGADISHAILSRADMSFANLKGTNLTSANLANAKLVDANLRNANLRESNLADAHLERATLTYANLEQAYLRDANLISAVLTRSNFQGADCTGANFQGAIIYETKGLPLGVKIRIAAKS